MESGAISDKQISASSAYPNRDASRGRLHSGAVSNEVESWSASVRDGNQWLQIDLGSRSGINLTGVATQGGTNHRNQARWVKEYKLQYSDDGVNFQYYKDMVSWEYSTGNTESYIFYVYFGGTNCCIL